MEPQDVSDAKGTAVQALAKEQLGGHGELLLKTLSNILILSLCLLIKCG